MRRLISKREAPILDHFRIKVRCKCHHQEFHVYSDKSNWANDVPKCDKALSYKDLEFYIQNSWWGAERGDSSDGDRGWIENYEKVCRRYNLPTIFINYALAEGEYVLTHKSEKF